LLNQINTSNLGTSTVGNLDNSIVSAQSSLAAAFGAFNSGQCSQARTKLSSTLSFVVKATSQAQSIASSGGAGSADAGLWVTELNVVQGVINTALLAGNLGC